MIRSSLLLVAVLALTRLASAQTAQVLIDDPLTSGESVGVVNGGALSDRGYTLTENHAAQHIQYSLPHAVENGFVEFEVLALGVDADDLAHEIGLFAMYDARGIDEPADYWADFKQNLFRFNVHLRSERQAIKAVVTTSRKTPEQLAQPKAVYAGKEHSDRDWSKEPTGPRFEFTPDQWTHVRIEWGGGTFRVKLNDTNAWELGGSPHAYAPDVPHIWLGSAPGYGRKYTSRAGLTFRNFKLVEGPVPEPKAPKPPAPSAPDPASKPASQP
jgi:hypothetical protein